LSSLRCQDHSTASTFLSLRYCVAFSILWNSVPKTSTGCHRPERGQVFVSSLWSHPPVGDYAVSSINTSVAITPGRGVSDYCSLGPLGILFVDQRAQSNISPNHTPAPIPPVEMPRRRLRLPMPSRRMRGCRLSRFRDRPALYAIIDLLLANAWPPS